MTMLQRLRRVLHSSAFGLWIVAVLRWLRLTQMFDFARGYAGLKRCERHPTEQMRASQRFFDANRVRVDTVVSWLADEKSRTVYRGMIAFRCHLRMRDFPPVSAPQYFCDGLFAWSPDEVFVDCGAYQGETIGVFERVLRGHGLKPARVVAFEPDPDSARMARRLHPSAHLFESGVWSRDTELAFEAGNDVASRLVEAGGAGLIHVPVRCLDGCPECEDATFIKMDVEGAELEALRGAERLILRNKPKLAICIYHSDEDMIRLAEWIHAKVPGYRLFVRQHSKYDPNETVLYATL